MTKPDGASPVTVFICTACGQTDDMLSAGISPGRHLLENLKERLAADENSAAITLTPVDCLAVCERPLTLAFSAPGKWSYVIGDVVPERDAADVLTAAKAVADAPHGVPPLKDRPSFFRKGVICRLPPVTADT